MIKKLKNRYLKIVFEQTSFMLLTVVILYLAYKYILPNGYYEKYFFYTIKNYVIPLWLSYMMYEIFTLKNWFKSIFR